MRTTLTLDDDLALQLQDLAHRQGRSFKDIVNQFLRLGLASAERVEPRRYRLEPSHMGGPLPGVDLERALRLADALEDAEIARKLELQK